MADPNARHPKAAACPICGKPGQTAHTPFCSARCADVDLGRWFGGSYRLPGPNAEPEEDAPDGDV